MRLVPWPRVRLPPQELSELASRWLNFVARRCTCTLFVSLVLWRTRGLETAPNIGIPPFAGPLLSPSSSAHMRLQGRQRRLHDFEYVDLPDELILRRGLKVVVTKNVDQRNGIVNATSGICRSWENTVVSSKLTRMRPITTTNDPPWWKLS